ncbi:trypsin-like peptidase domain-containing protein [Deefgea piscis]|uniref:Trypsin-like peptidase domain-containing protein n=1 Tax=Deefgea piscis TaxID=2739061 RepID=A0A6M8SNR0_9NEIS|nr:ABC-three component system protein [Deefgea piscis]QKJ66833.1 trypsin-like peptidase domain-containing protein [Deefgea piscis]
MYELISTYCVMVNEASGVLVSAMSSQYSYVLTARHALKETNTLTDYVGNAMNVIDVHQHPDAAFDCAIIKVDYVPNIKQTCCSASTVNHNDKLMFAGFPELSRRELEKIKHWDGEFTSITNELFIFTAEGIPSVELINGMSGGGVYYLCEGRAYLIGVECSMDGTDVLEMFGRLRCNSLRRFEDITSHFSLSPILPGYLECFSSLKDRIFEFNVVEPLNINKLKEKLLSVADLLVTNGLPAPYKLMMQYRMSLLLAHEHESAIQDSALWEAYFEFLIICAIIDNVVVIDEKYLSGLEGKRRIVYSRSEKNWLCSLADILKAAKNTLDAEGTIIVNSPQENAQISPPPSYLANIIDDISSVPTDGALLQIDNISESIYKTYAITHLKGLRNKCVIENEWDYKELPASQLLTHFKGKYNAFVK